MLFSAAMANYFEDCMFFFLARVAVLGEWRIKINCQKLEVFRVDLWLSSGSARFFFSLLLVVKCGCCFDSPDQIRALDI